MLYGSPLNTSISRLESFAACPFSYYIQYGLKAKERKVFRLTPPDTGTFMHSVIDRFSRKLQETDMSWRQLERKWCNEQIAVIVDELLKNTPGLVYNSSERHKYLAGRLKRILGRAIWLIAEHIKRGSFEPLGYEVVFSDGGDFPPIEVGLPSGEVIKLTGRIDRIDAMQTDDGTYLRIIDYKSGSKAFKLSDVYYGLQIQLFTYLDAIWDGGVKKLKGPLLPGGILYFRLDDPIIRGEAGDTGEEIEKAIMRQLKMKGLLLADVKLIKEMDSEIDGDSLIIPARINKDGMLGRSSAASADQFLQLRRHIKSLLAKLGDGILKGDVSIKPYKNKKTTSCAYCSYLPVCQFDPSMKDNKYRILDDMKDEDVWKQMEGGAGNG